ncbi:3TM-type holin [Magnetofaba australis]|uniref:Holin of 3TMs, for gene-transfer release n=1 Tax=Magnetofaba australis IT-1 TaxID=1434232 RepID=A0A1Y2K7X4_9PROT|nr:3TM-type holin [Magnetofaba australis]OSM04472.1 hypothetical protein MAIT1_05309 [Magnetofaba australis IT-1]
MGILEKIIGGAAAQPIEAVGKALDGLFTSDEERLDKQALLTRLAQQPAALQVELNKIEAAHRSTFVAGWRPFLGWVCGVGLSFAYVINPIIQWVTGQPGPQLPLNFMQELVVAMLGLAGLRTWEKHTGRAK